MDDDGDDEKHDDDNDGDDGNDQQHGNTHLAPKQGVPVEEAKPKP